MSTATRTPPSAAPRTNSRQLVIIGGVVVAVLAVLTLAIALSGQLSRPNIDFSAIPQSRTADGAFVLGDPDAPFTLIEFADFGCPACQSYHPDIQRFIKDFVVTGQAKFEYRTMPTAGGARTIYASQLSECAEEQRPGAHWETYSLFYDLALTAQYTDEIGRIAADRLGLNYSELISCSADANQLQADLALAQRLGFSATPSVAMREGSGEPTYIVWEGTTYNRGAVSYDVLAQLVRSYQIQ